MPTAPGGPAPAPTTPARRVAERLTAQGMHVDGPGRLKSAPRGYRRDHPRIELLRHKGLIGWQSWPVAAWLGTAGAKGRVVRFLRAAAPLLDWLNANVGPSTQAPPPAR